jgi:hypothetical protein
MIPGEAWTALALLTVGVLTYIIAPKLDAARKAKSTLAENARVIRRDDLTAIREEQAQLRADYREQIAELRIEVAQKDGRIGILEAQVQNLTTSLETFKRGLTHPPGYVLVPHTIWESLRRRLGDQLPPGPFVGEDIPQVEAP